MPQSVSQFLSHRIRVSATVLTGGLAWLSVVHLAAAQRPSTAEIANGFRQLAGQHLTLVTDLPPAPAVDDLPAVFDQAVVQWSEYFDVPLSHTRDWHIRGYLMVNRDRFRQAGWLPDTLPPFPHGYQRGDEIWVVEQPSDYYRRHLVLHEGTHAFMNRWLKGTGPPWYMEGTAELLATHRYDRGELTLNVVPQRKEDVPEWGRIKLIRNAVAEGRALPLADVFALPPRQFGDVDAYAWSWAASALLEGHSRWRDRFHALAARAAWDRDQFNEQLRRDLQNDREDLEQAWQIMLHELDYGYDVAQDEVIERPLRSWQLSAMVEVESDRGWQSTGLRLREGQHYRVTTQGRYQLNQEQPPWYSEAGGVTIHYRRGWPTGILLAAIRPPAGSDRALALAEPQPIGLDASLRPDADGILYLRINEMAGQLADNRGKLQVHVQAVFADERAQPD